MATLGDDLLGTVNKLQDLVFNTIGNDSLDLPQIVVVGSQSAGKSSVLENIVGRDFLPRGSGIVTRRPLILQLINVPDPEAVADAAPGSTNGFPPSATPPDPPNPALHAAHGASGPATVGPARRNEWAEFHHLLGRSFSDFADVKREIENETARVAGPNKGIHRQPINLKIYSPHVLNLTLVDLPGLTKVPIGDQPSDIEKQTRTLISEYIAKPNSIVLAVSPANVDLVNSEALKLARHVDPLGRRTVGVLTKLDLMDHGTNALDILAGRVYPLKLGWIGLVNRSQHDIQANTPMATALAAEADFFRHHPAYRNIAARCGSRFLAVTLNHTLMAHIRDRLPDIKARLNTLMGQTQQELASYGDMHFSGPEHRGSLILQLMTRFANAFIASIDGNSSAISTKELCGGARIYYIFNQVFGSALDSIDPTASLTAMDIRTAIRNSSGPRPSLFVPEMAFDLLVQPQIKLLELPSQRCVEQVYEELIKICHTCGSTELSRFPRLQAKLIEVVSDLLRERLGPASSYVESLIAIQRAYINTNHPNFLGAAAAMSHVVSAKQDRDRRRLIADERDRRDRRRLKTATTTNNNNNNGSVTATASAIGNGVGGDGLTLDDDDTLGPVPVDSSAIARTGPGPDIAESAYRRKHTHGHMQPPPLRNLSPAATRGDQGHNSLATAINGVGASGGRPASPSRFGGGARDSFLNYFFGKDGQAAATSAGAPGVGSAGHSPGLPPSQSANSLVTRHVSQTSEPSFSQSIRRGDERRRDDDLDYGRDAMSVAGNEPALSDREAMETELIRALISSYFNIVRESIADQVPKAIMHLLVNHCKDVVQNRLVSELYKEVLFEDLLYEDDGVKKERQKCEKLLQTYREAAKIIGEVL